MNFGFHKIKNGSMIRDLLVYSPRMWSNQKED